MKGIEYNLINNEMNENMYRILKTIESNIKDAMNNYELVFSRRSIDHFLTLVAEYNEAIASAILYDHNTYDGETNTVIFKAILLDDRLIDDIKYIYTKEFNEIIKIIVKNNQDIFSHYDLYHGKNSNAYKFSYNKYECKEYTTEDLRRITDVDNKEARKGELMNLLLEYADDISYSEIIKAYKTKYNLLRCLTPYQLSTDGFEDENDVEYNRSKFSSEIRNIQDPWNYLNEYIIKFFDIISKFDSNATPELVEYRYTGLEPHSLYSDKHSFSNIYKSIADNISTMNEEGLLTDEIKEYIESATHILNIGIRNTEYKLAQYAGREYYIMFNEYIKIIKNLIEDVDYISNINIEIGNKSKVYSDYNESEFIFERINDIQRNYGIFVDSRKIKKITVKYAVSVPGSLRLILNIENKKYFYYSK